MKTIGIDLGHCETAAAITLKKRNKNKYAVNPLCLQDRNQIINTQIVLTNAQMEKLKGNSRPSYELLSELGKIKIGNDLPQNVVDGEKFIYFKVPPKDFDNICAHTTVGKEECKITHGMVMACYAFALMQNVCTYNPSDITAADFKSIKLLVGCPSTENWTGAEEETKYAELLKNATGVDEVEIVPESRAAMFSSIEKNYKRVSAVNGALVFDFGSSTADCTYMQMGKKELEFSWTLGASKIEQNMVQNALMQAQEEQNFTPDTLSVANCENDLRDLKEQYYNKVYGEDGKEYICTFKESNQGTKQQKNKYRTIIEVNDEFMKKVTAESEFSILCDSQTYKKGTWRSLCEDFFTETKEQLQNADAPLEAIVLTGGASNMDFVYELCCEVFSELDNDHIILEANPSFTVANGLGWVANTDSMVDKCMADAKKQIYENESCSINALKEKIIGSVWEKTCSIINDETNNWKSLPNKHSVNELMNNIKNEIEKTQQEINESMLNEQQDWWSELFDVITKVVNKQKDKLYSDELSSSFIYKKDFIPVFKKKYSLSKLINKILKNIQMNTIATDILDTIFFLIIPLWPFLERDRPNIENRLLSERNRRHIASQINRRFVVSNPDDEFKNEIYSDSDLKEFEKDYKNVIDNTLTQAFEIITLKRFDAELSKENTEVSEAEEG